MLGAEQTENIDCIYHFIFPSPFNSEWNKELKNRKKQTPSLRRAIMRAFGFWYFMAGLLSILSVIPSIIAMIDHTNFHCPNTQTGSHSSSAAANRHGAYGHVLEQVY